MNIQTKAAVARELDKPLNNKNLRGGNTVWSAKYGLCIVAREQKNPILTYLVNLSTGSSYPICGESLFDMDKYYEFNVEHNYPSHFERE